MGTSVPQVSQGMWVCVCVTGSPWCVGRGHRAEWQAGPVPHLRSNLPHPLRPTGRPDWSPTVRCGGHKPAGGGAERERERRDTISQPMSAEIVWGRGQVTARWEAVGRGRARRVAPPTPVNGCSEGGSGGRGRGASSGKGWTGPGGRSRPRSLGEVPLGKAWVADLWVAPLARPPRETESGGASPKSPGERRDGPGLRGAEPAPFLGLRCAQPRTETDLPRHNPEERPGSPTAHFLPRLACGARPPVPGPSQGGTRDTRPVPVPPPTPGGVHSVTFRRRVVHLLGSPGENGGPLWETHSKPEGPKAQVPLYSFYFLFGVRGGGGPEPGGNVSSVLRVTGHAL